MLHRQLPLIAVFNSAHGHAADRNTPSSLWSRTTATCLLHVLLHIVLQAPYLATLEPQQGMPGSSATLFPSCSLDTPSPRPTTSLQEPIATVVIDVIAKACRATCPLLGLICVWALKERQWLRRSQRPPRRFMPNDHGLLHHKVRYPALHVRSFVSATKQTLQLHCVCQ